MSTKENDDVLRRVKVALQGERQLSAAFRLDALALSDNGTLTLQGEAPSVAAKKLALERVAAMEGVSAIADRLHVTPAIPMDDGEIRADLRTAFTTEPAFAGYAVRELRHVTTAPDPDTDYVLVAGDPATAGGEIDIEVRQGIVILNGRVPGLVSKRLAGVMAWWVPGVRDVVNGLDVTPPEDDAPIRIEEAVHLVLERDPRIDASQIRVGVRGRDVRLTGLVTNTTLRAMAERDAWCVFGVDRVINAIVVKRD